MAIWNDQTKSVGRILDGIPIAPGWFFFLTWSAPPPIVWTDQIKN